VQLGGELTVALQVMASDAYMHGRSPRYIYIYIYITLKLTMQENSGTAGPLGLGLV